MTISTHTRRAVALAVLAMLLCAPAMADITSTTVETVPPRTGEERRFGGFGSKVGDFTGILDSIEPYRANIIDPVTGRKHRIPLFYFSATDMCYLLEQAALRDVPATLTRWRFSDDEDGKHLLVDLPTGDLPLGPLKKIGNAGTLGGEFVKVNHPPTVREVQGRKGIFFTVDEAQYAPPEFQMLTSDFTLENRLDQKQPFTVSAWIYVRDEPTVEAGKTILSWHSIGGDHGTALRYGRSCDVGGLSLTATGTKGDREGATGIMPADRWQHVTFTYTGGEDGTFRVYVDGAMTHEKQYDHIVEKGTVTDITATQATIQAGLRSKTGKATVSFYLGEKDHKHWFQMRHVRWESGYGTLEWAPEGEVQWTFEGLKPETTYYYRIMSIDYPADHWSYHLNPMRRWMYGPGAFVTASADGKTPGRVIEEDRRKHFFVGGNWGAHWYMANKGPNVQGFFNGGMADLKVYDYAMSARDVSLHAGAAGAADPDQADGESTRSFKESLGYAKNPNPAVGAAVHNIYRLRWTTATAPPLTSQNLYIAETPEALDAMTEPTARLKEGRNGTDHYALTGTETIPGKTYYWRVDSLFEPREPVDERRDPKQPDHAREPGKIISSRTAKGDVWSFTTQPYFTPERDIVSHWPNPDGNTEASRGAKILKLDVGPGGVTTIGADQERLLHKVIATSKMYGKSKRVLMGAGDWIANTLGSHEGHERDFFGGFGTGQAYGNVDDPSLLLVHEMGHEIFNLIRRVDKSYHARIEELWMGTADNNFGLAGYSARNIDEYMAVYLQVFTSPSGREGLYEKNFPLAVAASDYLPGTLTIDLDAGRTVAADENGWVTAWKNLTDVDKWDSEHARFDPDPDMLGDFKPYGGKPKWTTVQGVTAVSFDGTTALKWDRRIKWNLSRNLPFSVAYWVYQPAAASGAGDQLIAGWGEKNEQGTGFYLGGDGTIYDHGQGKTARLNVPEGQWNHVVHVYKGPGADEGSMDKGTGVYRVYVNGRVAHETPMAFSIPQKQTVYVAGRVDRDGRVSEGFVGALASVRIYDYDLSFDQVVASYANVAPHMHRDALEVADMLYVDLDARLLADTHKRLHRPVYPPRLRKPWLRSWSNKGTLGGRMHNDIHALWGYSGSRPVLKTKMGATMPVFAGMDRMVSGFEPTDELLNTPPGTLELWLENAAEHPGEVILQWGDFVLTADALPQGQQTVTVMFSESPESVPASVYVNGQRVKKTVGALKPRRGQRLHLGGRYDDVRYNWKDYWHGTMAGLRLHKGRLTEKQIAANAASHVFAAGGTGVAPPRRETAPPLIALRASELEKGPLKEWKNAGSAKIEFVAGTRGDIGGLPAYTHEGVPAVHIGTRALTATFETPGNLKSGPFTLHYQVVQRLQGGAQLLSWGNGDVVLRFGDRILPNRTDATLQVYGQTTTAERTDPHRAALLSMGQVRDATSYNEALTITYSWRKISVVYDGKAMTYYIDGHLSNEAALGGLNITNDGRMILGSTRDSRSYVYLHSLKVLPRALSQKEITALNADDALGDREALVNVRVPEGLRNGETITTLKNAGRLGGAFSAEPDVDHAPTVIDVDGVRAVAFDGKAAFMISTANTPEPLTLDYPFTVEMRVRPETFAGDQTVFALAQGMGFRVSGVGRDRVEIPDTLKPQQWMHLAYTFDGTTLRMFLDGKPTRESGFPGWVIERGTPLYVGADFDPEKGEARAFNGAIQSITVYDYARTVEEIAQAPGRSVPIAE